MTRYLRRKLKIKLLFPWYDHVIEHIPSNDGWMG